MADDDRLMSVPIKLSNDGKTVDPVTPLPLFVTNIGSTATLKYRQQHDVSRDAESFILHPTVAGGDASPIRVILNGKPKR